MGSLCIESMKAAESMGSPGEGEGSFSQPACLKIARPFSSYLADQFLSSFRGVQAGAD